jgi:hypothetical protein
MRGLSGASGAERLCALGALAYFCAAPQLHLERMAWGPVS